MNPTFDPVVGSHASKDNSSASTSAQEVADGFISERDVFILEKQAQQEEQLRQLFSLVTTLGSDIRSVVKVVASSSEQRLDHQSDPAHKEKGKAARRIVSFEIEEDDEENLNDDEIGNDDDGGYCADNNFVSHCYYRALIAEGFDKRFSSRPAVNKPSHFPIDDSVTRTLTASKYSSKAAEYSITVANAFFCVSQ